MYDGLNGFGSLYRSILDTYSKLLNAFVKWLRRFPVKKITLVRIRQANNVSSILKKGCFNNVWFEEKESKKDYL